MNGLSDFRLVGTVTCDCWLHRMGKDGRPLAKFAMAVKVPFSHQKTCRFPIVAFDSLAMTAKAICRTGAKVAVSGTLVSEDAIDYEKGEEYVRMYLYAFEILCLAKSPPKRALSKYAKRFSELTDLAPTEPNNFKRKR
jgi:single-stranded DNA-binding protein